MCIRDRFKVAKDQKVFVHRLAAEEGASVSFDNVLMLSEGDKVTVGAPAIDGAQVGAKIIKHLKGDKVIVFKKKRRKGYRVKNGHRQSLTQIVIESIVASGAKKASPAKKAKAAAPKAEKPAAKKQETASKDVSSNTVAELKAMAKQKGITGYTSMKKAELIAALS